VSWRELFGDATPEDLAIMLGVDEVTLLATQSMDIVLRVRLGVNFTQSSISYLELEKSFTVYRVRSIVIDTLKIMARKLRRGPVPEPVQSVLTYVLPEQDTTPGEQHADRFAAIAEEMKDT